MPAFKNAVNALCGGPAIPAAIISLVFGIVVSMITPEDTTPEKERLERVFADREGKVAEIANKNK